MLPGERWVREWMTPLDESFVWVVLFALFVGFLLWLVGEKVAGDE